MKKLLVLSTCAAIMLSPLTVAAQVNMEFKSPDNYRDIYHGSTQSKTKFRKRLFDTLEATFAERAKELPANYSLEVTFLDIDLAGEVQRGMTAQIRTISDHDFPRLHFYMVLKDDQGNIILQGEQNLKERKDKHSAFRMKGSQSEFYLETELVNKWFDLALLPKMRKISA